MNASGIEAVGTKQEWETPGSHCILTEMHNLAMLREEGDYLVLAMTPCFIVCAAWL